MMYMKNYVHELGGTVPRYQTEPFSESEPDPESNSDGRANTRPLRATVTATVRVTSSFRSLGLTSLKAHCTCRSSTASHGVAAAAASGHDRVSPQFQVARPSLGDSCSRLMLNANQDHVLSRFRPAAAAAQPGHRTETGGGRRAGSGTGRGHRQLRAQAGLGKVTRNGEGGPER